MSENATNKYTLTIFPDSFLDHAIWSTTLMKNGALCTNEPCDSDGYEVCDSPVLGEIQFYLTEEHISGAIEHLDTTGLEDTLADFANEALGYYQELKGAGKLEFKDA